jgi:hypothetical protein
VDPDPTINPDFSWEWRCALFKLSDLERLFANASRENAKKTPWDQIPHPLGACLNNRIFWNIGE